MTEDTIQLGNICTDVTIKKSPAKRSNNNRINKRTQRQTPANSTHKPNIGFSIAKQDRREQAFSPNNKQANRKFDIFPINSSNHNISRINRTNTTTNTNVPFVKGQQTVSPKPSFKAPKLFDESILKDIQEIESLSVSVKHEDLFSETKFSDFNCDPLLVACLKQRFSLETATKVQSLSIPALLNGKDALVKSATGSGKTLAYSIPMVHSLQALEPKLDRSKGIHALVIVPTRELALQTFDCLNLLLQPFRRMVLGMLVGGEKKKSEKARIRKGLNILVATPGRLLDHLNRTSNLKLDNLKWLVIDEADRLYEQGFSAIIGQVMEHIQRCCPTALQTVLLSATLSKGVKELAGLSLKSPEIVDVGDEELRMDRIVLPDSLENSYMIVPAKLRLVILSCILLKSLSQHVNGSKMIVFMSCQDVVDFFSTLLNITLNKVLESINKKITILQLRGNMNQNDRTQTFKKFHDAEFGILFCTDVVSRGLDLPNVDLIVQMSVPPLVEDYVHRVGRTARVGTVGRSILVLLPSETKFIHHLQGQLSIDINAIKVEQYFDALNSIPLETDNLHTNQERLAHLHHLLEQTIYDDENLHKMAAKAYLSHLRAYASYPHKMSYCLPFKELHLGHIAKSFALRESPSELGAVFHKQRRILNANKIKDTSSLKRRNIPLEDKVSEFGGMIVKAKKIRKSE